MPQLPPPFENSNIWHVTFSIEFYLLKLFKVLKPRAMRTVRLPLQEFSRILSIYLLSTFRSFLFPLHSNSFYPFRNL
ncbi:hypothetical protein EYC80_002641 [Monilinia laxa]|uniref:Uncharacterized protein n=1 Tax=Monilinia laxa TaxID=61186 RepID=A0A5N6K4G9_MONLA|nr:hypothetical protein EYC80_002641 [Monilinia laxa]